MGIHKVIIWGFIIFFGTGKTLGQKYSIYSNDTLVIESEYLQETINLNLHLPETQPFSASNTTYPITIIFDSQHERTYPQIINSFDLLTNETQIPESIIIGVPFSIKNRFYFTSNQKLEGDSLSGLERMEYFLFSEIIPKIQNEFKGNNFISIIGHSRTGFLVNYLSYKKPNEINIAVSLSGFFNDQPLSTNLFYSFLTDSRNFPNKFNYYYTAGTTQEESTYLSQFSKLDSLLSKKSIPENVKVTFHKTSNANHITNYWVSLPPILIDAFSRYNSVLDSWFYDKLKSEVSDLSVEQFKLDLDNVSNEIGVTLNPNLTHIFSLASHFAYSKNNYKRAIDFIEFGLKYYPDYPQFYIEIIEFYKILNDLEKVNQTKSILREKTEKSLYLSSSEKGDIYDYLDEK